MAFSAITVACALAALIVFRQRFLYSMGVGGALCALIAAGVSLTLLPALLGILGERVNAGGPRRWKEAIAREARAERSGFWYRHSQRVMRRPIPVATGAAVLLLALGAPFLTIRFTGIDPSRAAQPPAGADRRRRDQDRVPAERDLAGLRRVRRARGRRCARTRRKLPRRSRRRG